VKKDIMICSSTKDTVRQIFTEYLESRGFRKTPIRFSILEVIYCIEGHFDIEQLYIHMKNNNYSVSRATLYNTIEVLLDCKLIVKHQFGKLVAQYEKSYECKQHDHLICTECGSVSEFCDPRINEIKKTVGDLMVFKIKSHSLYFYGLCKSCFKQN
jgi:Fur family transcriptional regulator, ferric uptake regulator